MPQKQTTVKPGTVTKIIKVPGQSEKAEIAIDGADDLYREIRIENKLEDAHGHKVKLKEHAKVDVKVEADATDTVPLDHGSAADSKATTSKA